MGCHRFRHSLTFLIEIQNPSNRQVSQSPPITFSGLQALAGGAVSVAGEAPPHLAGLRRGGAGALGLPASEEGREDRFFGGQRERQPSRSGQDRAEDAAGEGLFVARVSPVAGDREICGARAEWVHGGVAAVFWRREERGGGEGERLEA